MLTWIDTLKRKRDNYSHLKAKAIDIVDIDLYEEINKDLERLYMRDIDENYFEVKETRNMIRTTLIVWSKTNSSLSYRQGMHELVGLIFFVLDGDARSSLTISTKNSRDQNLLQIARDVMSIEHVESDTYIMFSALMESMKVMYFMIYFPCCTSRVNICMFDYVFISKAALPHFQQSTQQLRYNALQDDISFNC
jgi:hypothetical protein